MCAGNADFWEDLGRRAQPNWYLDPLVAQWKKRDHMKFLRRWMPGSPPARILKTDLFEEAFGEDALLFDLFPVGMVCGMDLSASTVRQAGKKAPDARYQFSVGDLRMLPFQPGAFDFILSTSSLDHFETAREFDNALGQLIQALSPGGRLILTLDNIWNPLYFPLKWFSRFPWSPFPLGYAPCRARLRKAMQRRGLRILGSDCLVHNPRMLSTLLFLSVRRAFGPRADRVIAALLRTFSLADNLPSRFLTACFIAVIAEKPKNPA
ncbi:MAG: class I SAM-dependent methyltransferase [Acidobacteriota bacterium]|nr:class I SAM-dependent methyltransferase [Acidobacteriota bacterium]